MEGTADLQLIYMIFIAFGYFHLQRSHKKTNSTEPILVFEVSAFVFVCH